MAQSTASAKTRGQKQREASGKLKVPQSVQSMENAEVRCSRRGKWRQLQKGLLRLPWQLLLKQHLGPGARRETSQHASHSRIGLPDLTNKKYRSLRVEFQISDEYFPSINMSCAIFGMYLYLDIIHCLSETPVDLGD